MLIDIVNDKLTHGDKMRGGVVIFRKIAVFDIWRVVLLVAVLLTLVSPQNLLATMPVITALPENITLTWADDPKTTQTISWRSAVATAGKVQYREDGLTLTTKLKTAIATVQRMPTNLGSVNINSVTLTGLKPGTRYTYRVGDSLGWTEPNTFLTAADQTDGFKILVFGDSQSVDYSMWRTTICQAYQSNLDAAFFTNVGDLVDTGDDYVQWKAWFDAVSGVASKIPVMPVLGNHENFTIKKQFALPTMFTSQFKLPSNGPEGLKGQVYSFDYGQVHFIMLDTQESEERQFIPQMLLNQKKWLEKELATTEKKWKVVFMHRAPYDNTKNPGNENIRAAFTPIFDKYHVDLVFTAHDHICGRTYPLYEGVAVNDAAKGTIYVPVGRSGTKTYTNRYSKVWNQVFYNPLDMPNYLTMEVQGDILTVRTFKQNGELIDSWSIEKVATNSFAKISA